MRVKCNRTAMVFPLVTVFLTLVAACSPSAPAPIASPDGSMILVTSIEQSHRDPTTYLCVVFEIQDKAGRILHKENTRASSIMRWNISWVSNDRIKLESSDIGKRLWTRQPSGSWLAEAVPVTK